MSSLQRPLVSPSVVAWDDFLGWVDGVERVSRLANPASVVRWNTSKRYLRDLAGQGVPVVPTAWLREGEPIPAEWVEVVVKPAVSAGGRWTGRYADHEAATAFARTLAAGGDDVLVHPYVSTVDRHGEFGIFFFGGEPSHAIRKAAILSVGEEPVPDNRLAVRQRVAPVPLDETPVDFARSVLDAVPGGSDLLYARVDCVADDDGADLLLELELVEPHLFLQTSAGAAARFAAALTAWAAR